MRPDDAFLDVFQRAEIFDDVAAGVVEENIAVLVPANGHQPFQFVTVFQQVVDRLVGAFAGDNGYLGVGGFSYIAL